MSNVALTNLTLDSREVAEMVEKEHKHLLADIRNYEGYLGETNLRLTDFFIPSTYKTIQNKELPNYQVTKKGCEFIAHKLTGQKGALFTANYINKFHAMEQTLRPQSIEDLIILQAQSMKELRHQVSQVETTANEATRQIEQVKDTIIHTDADWRKWVNKQFQKIGYASGGDYQTAKTESYSILEKRARCLLERRLENLRARMKQAGLTKTKIDNANYMDVIEQEPRLKEIYTTIVKELAIKHMGRVPVGR